MLYLKVTNDGYGGSKFEDVEVAQTETPFAENVPPVLVSGPIAATGVVFVTTPSEVREFEPHPAPRRALVVMLEGEVEAETTDGEKRVIAPGMVALAEDVEGRGHVSRVVSPGPATFMVVTLAD
jgi:hypothetical protein